MGIRSFGITLLVLFLTLSPMLFLLFSAAARPIGPNPETSWLENTLWGARIAVENQEKDVKEENVWWGARAGPEFTEKWTPPGASSYVDIWILQGGDRYFKVVREDTPPPQEYSWLVQVVADSPGTHATLKWELENGTHWFVPPDFSAVLENAAAGLRVNLREGENFHVVLPLSATLHVDNAVNIENFENTTPLEGSENDNVSFAFDIVNTGRYPDNYAFTVNAGGWTVGNWSPDDNAFLNPGESLHVTFDVTIGIGSREVNVEATGSYAWDNTFALRITPPGWVRVEVVPSENGAPPGENVTFEVIVTNTGDAPDNYVLTVENSRPWPWKLDDNLLEVPAGENRCTTLRVSIPDDAENCTYDNLKVTAISLNNPSIENHDNCRAHAVIIRGVEVSISPRENSGAPGQTLIYMVTVKNTGNILDNYLLENFDNLGWPLSLDNDLLTIPAGENREVALRVTIPDNSLGCTRDNLEVRATSVGNENVTDSDGSVAHVEIVCNVEVSVSPRSREGRNSENLYYNITVCNLGNVEDNFQLRCTQGEWLTIIEPDGVGPLPPFNGTENARLIVQVPENLPGGTEEEIVIVAESERCGTTGSDNVLARVAMFRAVQIEITPEENIAEPCTTLEYSIRIRNTGSVDDNYRLSWEDTAGWGDNIRLSDNLLQVEHHRSATATLFVHIPACLDACVNNITVTAVSVEDEEVRSEDSCIAGMAISRGVELSISPARASGYLGETVSYEVEVINVGTVVDDYSLSVSDNAGWATSLSKESVENVLPDGGASVSLDVTIPENAVPGTVDKITVVAVSEENTDISGSASCTLRARVLRRVEVSISPDYQTGAPGDTLEYAVTVANTGQVADSYDLSVTASIGWFPTIDPTTLDLEPGQSGEATLTVDVPSDLEEGDAGLIEARAVSIENRRIQGDDTCRAIVQVGGEGAVEGFPWTEIIIISTLIVGILFAIGVNMRVLASRLSFFC